MKNYNTELLEEYRRCGWATIPVGPDKNPLCKWRGIYDWDADKVNQWQPGDFNESGFAVIVKPGYVGLDFDNEEIYQKFIDYLDGWEPTTHRKTRRGYHVMLGAQQERNWRTGASNTLLGEGLDIRAAEKAIMVVSYVDEEGERYVTRTANPKNPNTATLCHMDDEIQKLADSTFEKNTPLPSPDSNGDVSDIPGGGDGVSEKIPVDKTPFEDREYLGKNSFVDPRAQWKEGNRYDNISRYMMWVGVTYNFNLESMIRWADWFQRCCTAKDVEIKPYDKIVAMAKALHDKRKNPKDQVWVQFPHDKKFLRGRSGVTNDILLEGLQRLGLRVRFNKRFDRKEIFSHGKWEQLSENELARIGEYANTKILTGLYPESIEGKKGWYVRPSDAVSLRWGVKQVESVLARMFKDVEEDPFITDYLDKLPEWDGIPRIESMLSEIFEIKKDEKSIAELVGRCIMMGAIRRTYDPGSRHDECPILIGPEGCGKSTFCEHLAPHYHYYKSGYNWATGRQKMVEQTLGKVIVEASEMMGMDEKTAESIKDTISSSVNKIRLPFRRDAFDYLATHIFIGTSNEKRILPYAGHGGNRRFIPLEVGRGEKCPSEYLKENRDQLWAEAKHYYSNGEIWELEGDVKATLADHVVKYGGAPNVDQRLELILQKHSGKEVNEKVIWDELSEEIPFNYTRKDMRRQTKYCNSFESRKRDGKGGYNIKIK